jgi:transposase
LNQKKLTEKQKHRLNQILFEFDPKGYLRDAYLAKELFNEAVDTKDISLLEKVINGLKASLHYKVKTCGETLEKWKAEIINFFKTNLSNAFTE